MVGTIFDWKTYVIYLQAFSAGPFFLLPVFSFNFCLDGKLFQFMIMIYPEHAMKFIAENCKN